MSKPVILTGLRANGELHLGSYLGAILPMVQMQQAHAGQYQINMFVPDLHSFTTPVDLNGLQKQIVDDLRIFVAAGLDISNQDTFVYRQSYVPAHSELTLILNNFTYFGELNRMTQFKEKSDELKESSVTAGLFDYPVLMASDILLYGAQYIPVGEDQQQHIELTRDIAMRMNNKFGDLFTVPEEWNKQLEFSSRDKGLRIRSLRNPEKKMSKSIEDPAGTILLSDKPLDAAKKIMSATTDSLEDVQYDFEARPGISNLLDILKTLGGDYESFIGQKQYGSLKTAVADAVSAFLSDFQSKLMGVDDDAIQAKLSSSETAMNAVANQTLLRVQQAVGLRPKTT